MSRQTGKKAGKSRGDTSTVPGVRLRTDGRMRWEARVRWTGRDGKAKQLLTMTWTVGPTARPRDRTRQTTARLGLENWATQERASIAAIDRPFSETKWATLERELPLGPARGSLGTRCRPNTSPNLQRGLRCYNPDPKA